MHQFGLDEFEDKIIQYLRHTKPEAVENTTAPPLQLSRALAVALANELRSHRETLRTVHQGVLAMKERDRSERTRDARGAFICGILTGVCLVAVAVWARGVLIG